MFEYLGKDLSLSNRLVLANRWLSEPLLLSRLGRSPATNAITRTTVAPTIMESGFKANVLPQAGRIAFSIRILPGMSENDVEGHILRAVSDPSLVVRVVGNEPSDPSPISNLESESFAYLRKAIHEVFPDVLSAPSLLVGRTDSRRYAEIADNSYRFLPTRLSGEDLARLHGTNERIAVANFAEIVRFYARLIEISAEGSGQ